MKSNGKEGKTKSHLMLIFPLHRMSYGQYMRFSTINQLPKSTIITFIYVHICRKILKVLRIFLVDSCLFFPHPHIRFRSTYLRGETQVDANSQKEIYCCFENEQSMKKNKLKTFTNLQYIAELLFVFFFATYKE